MTAARIRNLSRGTIRLTRPGLRFVAVPVPDMKNKLQSQMKQLETDVDGLGKKLHYLETTAKNSQDHIEAMLRRGDASGS